MVDEPVEPDEPEKSETPLYDATVELFTTWDDEMAAWEKSIEDAKKAVTDEAKRIAKNVLADIKAKAQVLLDDAKAMVKDQMYSLESQDDDLNKQFEILEALSSPPGLDEILDYLEKVAEYFAGPIPRMTLQIADVVLAIGYVPVGSARLYSRIDNIIDSASI